MVSKLSGQATHDSHSQASVQAEAQLSQRDLDQAELSQIFKRLPEAHNGLFALGPDGVFRSLTGDRQVVGAIGLRPALIKALLDRRPFDQAAEDRFRGVNGTKVPVELWWKPDRAILPEPLSEAEEREAEEFAELHREEIEEVARKRQAGNLEACGPLIKGDHNLGPKE